MTTPGAFIRTEIRFLQPDDYFVDERDRVCRKIGRQFLPNDNTRLGIKHLAVVEWPHHSSHQIVKYRAQAPVWADADPGHRAEYPIETVLDNAA